MTEELAPNATDNPVPAEPVEGQTEEGQKQETPIDPEFAGKSVGELAAMLKEAKSFSGRQSTEIGKIRELTDQVNYLRGMMESRPIQEAPTPPNVPAAQFDFTNPEGYIEQKMNEKLGKFQQEYQRREAENYVRSARVNFDRGRTAAIKGEPELFNGIEQEVGMALAQQVKAGSLSPELLGDANTWTYAAALIRLMRGERDKIAPSKRQGMSPVDLGVSQKSRSVADDDDVQLSEEDRRWAREQGYDEKTLVEATRRGQQMRQKGFIR
jgi:hypothetical protein